MYMVVVLEDGVLANLLYEYVLFICIYTHTYVFFLNIYLDRPIGIGTPPASVICPAGLRCSFLPSLHPYKPHYSAAEALSTLQIS